MATLAQLKAMQYEVNLEKMNRRPKSSLPYQVTPNAREIVKQEIDGMLAMDILEPAQNEWKPPTLFVPENDSTLRSWVEYRKLYAVTIRDSKLTMQMDEWIDLPKMQRCFRHLKRAANIYKS